MTDNNCTTDKMTETQNAENLVRGSFLPYDVESVETDKTFLNIRRREGLLLKNCGFDETGRIFSTFYQSNRCSILGKVDLRRSNSYLNDLNASIE